MEDRGLWMIRSLWSLDRIFLSGDITIHNPPSTIHNQQPTPTAMLTLLLTLSLAAMPSPAADTSDALPYYPDGVETIAVDGRDVAVVDRGDGPVLLFVHGLGSNMSLWREALPAFAEDYRVVALDLPGFGLSGKDDVPGTMAFYADTVRQVMDALAIEQATYVGVSMGGQVGMTLALRHPERLRRLVLVSPAGIETFTDQEAQAMKDATSAEGIANTPEEQVQKNVAANFHEWSDDYAWLIEQREALQQRGDFMEYARANARSVAGMLDAPVRDRLGEIETPALVLFGAGDKLIPNRYLHPDQTTAAVADTARSSLPNATVELVDDAGHLLMLERPAVFHERVREWLGE
jgi:pimeloyl-ACP methyl ester carboxylesterase